MVNNLDASWIKAAVKKSTELNSDKKLYFGGKGKFFKRKYKKIEKLNEGVRATNTAGISRKNTELMELLITETLKRNLKKEFEFLKVNYVKIDLNLVGKKEEARIKIAQGCSWLKYPGFK